MDPLSDVMRALRLSGAYFYLVEARAPWSVTTFAARDVVPRVVPDAEHLISCHVLVSGTCWGGADGVRPPERMYPGDAIVFPHGDPHLMSSDEGLRLTDVRLHSTPERFPGTVASGPDGPPSATFVCGFLGCDARPFNPLLASLPSQILVRGAAGGWLSQFPRRAAEESRAGRVGGATLLTRMAELMFIEIMRHHVESLPASHRGWLAALRDAKVGSAVAALHERPAHAWTLAELARATATSRTVLAERFSTLVGVSPMLYLTRWRLQLAAEQLTRGSAKVAAIAGLVGYESEAAFSRAFKRETGSSPAAWRRVRAPGHR